MNDIQSADDSVYHSDVTRAVLHSIDSRKNGELVVE